MTSDTIIRWAQRFPTLTDWPAEQLGLAGKFDPEKLHAWAENYASQGAQAAAMFLLHMWSNGYRFNLRQAINCWDNAHYVAFLTCVTELGALKS